MRSKPKGIGESRTKPKTSVASACPAEVSGPAAGIYVTTTDNILRAKNIDPLIVSQLKLSEIA